MKIIQFFLFLSLVIFPPRQAFAQGYFSNLFGEFFNLYPILLLVIFGLATVFFLWGVALLVLNAGDEKKRADGKKRMLWGIIMLTIMFSIWGIIEILRAVFGLTGSEVVDFPSPLGSP